MKIKSLCVIGLLPLLAGCAGYKSQSLNKLHPVALADNKKVAFAAKAFNECDCELYLGRNVVKAGYTPIQIAIKNNSEKNLRFSSEELNMRTVPTNIVAESVYQSILARALGYGIPAVLIPILFLPLGIPAITDSIWASQANEQLLSDYMQKSIRFKTLLKNTSVDGVIFVENNELNDELIVNLIDEDSREKIVCKASL